MARLDKNSDADWGTTGSYILGFGLSLALTMTAYLLVKRHVDSNHTVFSDSALLAAISVMAVSQLIVQLIYFLHLGKESKPRWNLAALSFAVIIVLVIVFGSVWIMANLNYHHGPHNVTHDGHILNSPQQTNQYIIQDEGVGH